MATQSSGLYLISRKTLVGLAALAAAACNAAAPIWVDADGDPVPATRMIEAPGPEHCGWETATFLILDGSRYLRDPEFRVQPRGREQLSGTSRLAGSRDLFEADATLPPDAEDSGLRDGGRALWTSPSEQGQAIYIVSADSIERWPRTFAGCD